jgi:hypothetical protein
MLVIINHVPIRLLNSIQRRWWDEARISIEELQDFALLFDNTRVSLIFMVAPGSRICTAKR